MASLIAPSCNMTVIEQAIKLRGKLQLLVVYSY
jgi:hypothetical protein